MKFLFIVVSLYSVAAQAGPQDGSGGRTSKSTPEQVEQAIYWAYQNLVDAPNNETPIEPFGENLNFSVNGHYVFTCIYNPQTCLSHEDWERAKAEKKLYYRPKDYLPLSKWTIKPDGPCITPDVQDAAAGVSEHKIGADICFSQTELMKVPPNGLKAEAFGLWIHEMCHMTGCDQETANKAQQIILAHWSRLTETDGRFVKRRLIREIDMALEAVRSARLADRDEETPDPKIHTERVKGAAIAFGHIQAINNFLPSRGNITLPIARPELSEQMLVKTMQIYDLGEDFLTEVSGSSNNALVEGKADRLIADLTSLKFSLQVYFDGTVEDADSSIHEGLRE